MNREHARLGINLVKNPGESFFVGEKFVRYGRNYFTIFANDAFLMNKATPIFFGPLNLAKLFDTRKKAGDFMRNNGIAGRVVRIETTFTAYGV